MEDTTWTGPTIATIRRSAGVSRAQVADRLGVSVSRVRNVELAAAVPDPLRRRMVRAVLDVAGEPRPGR